MAVVLAKNLRGSIVDVGREIRARVGRGEHDSFIYVVPTRRNVRELQRDLLHEIPSRVSPAFHLFTLETLASKLFSLVLGARRLVDGPTQAVLVHRAFDAVREELTYFAPRSSSRDLPRGTFQRIINVLNSLKEAGVYPAVLHDELNSVDALEKGKLRDILTIYEKYEELLGDRLIDHGGIFKEINRTWNEESAYTFRNAYPRVEMIFVAGFDEFSDPEITMLKNLTQVREVGMVVSFDYHPGNDQLFGHLRENYEKFIEAGFVRLHSPSSSGSSERPSQIEEFRSHVQNHLFGRGETSRIDVSDSVTIFKANDREEEVVAIAKLIKRLVNQTPGIDLSRICVALYRPQVYTNLFREVFARYGIPVNITDRYRLDQSPVVGGVMSLLQVWANNFRQRDVMRALSSPYFHFGATGRPIDFGNLYQISTALKISAGVKSWYDRIALRQAQIDDELLDAEDEGEVARLVHERERLERGKEDIATLVTILKRFDGELTPLAFKEAIVSLLMELRVVEQLTRLHTHLPEEQLEKDSRAYHTFLAFLHEYASIVSFDVRERGEAMPRMKLPRYLDELRVAMADVRYNIRQKYGYGVYVTAIEETRGLEFDVMFLAGLIDGEFPPPYKPEIFVSRVRQLRKELYHLTEHRYLFYQGLTNFTRKLYLSYPARDGELELVPSSFVEAVRKIFRCEEWTKGLPQELLVPVYSEEELILRLGRHIGQAVGTGETPDVPSPNDSLKEILNHIQHTIAVEHSRTVTHRLPEYEGILTNALSPSAKDQLAVFAKYIFSVSQLETFGACPFQYFSGRVLRLNVLEELEEGLTPLERGGLLHEILFEFYTGRRDRGLPPLFECSAEDFARAINELLAIARAKFDALNVPDPFWEIEKETILGGQGRKGLLVELMENERGRALEVRPMYFEAAFGPHPGSRRGSDELLAWPSPIDVGNVKLRGKVDRVEVGAGEERIFTIIDYKTGTKFAKRSEIEEGLSLQLPVYLYAVEKILSRLTGRPHRPAAGLYYNLRQAREELGIGNVEYRGLAFQVDRVSRSQPQNEAELRGVIQVAIDYVNKYVANIAIGKFPLTTPEKAKVVCGMCDFQTICRIRTVVSSTEESSTTDVGIEDA